MDEDEIEYYKNIGAINAHLDSIIETAKYINKTLDEAFKRLDEMKDRF